MTKKYIIKFSKKNIKELEKIPLIFRKSIKQAIDDLKIDPRPDGYIKLKGSKKESLYRIRCGDYRIVYTVDDHILLVVIIEIGDRKEIYR